MKKMKYILMPFVLLVFLNSCAPVYKCGDPIPAKTPAMWSKNLKSVVSERDNLCKTLAAKLKEIATLKDTISNLSGRHKDLNEKYKSLYGSNTALEGKYKDLINENLSKTDQYNKALGAKSDELNAKEKLLSEREKALAEMQVVIARQDSITKRLNKVLHDALLGFNSDELSVEIKNGKVYVSMSDKLLFKSGSSAVEDKGKEALKLLSDVLDKNTDIDILVEGHTDNVPIKTAVYKDNWDLSVARATSIVRILTTDYKIAPTRMTASGKGEYFPKSENDTPEGRARNRRTEIILSPKLDEIMKLLQNPN
jgi:chemotaxis protein MotB